MPEPSTQGRIRSRVLAAFFSSVLLVNSSQKSLALSDDDVFKYINQLADAVYLNESGLQKQAIAKTTSLIAELERNGSHGTVAKNLLVPVVRSNLTGGDTLKEIQAEAYALRGISKLALKQSALAIADLKKATVISPNNAYALSDLGTAYIKTKKNKEAVAVLTQAVKLNPNIREAYFMRANGYQQLGKRKEAQKDLVRAQNLLVEQQKNVDFLTEKIDDLVNEDKTPEAITLDRQLLQAAPRDALAITGYADHLTASGRFDDALNYISCAITLDPSNAYAYRIRSVIYSHLQRPELELRDANKAFILEPRSLEALNSRAIANLEMDRPRQAIRDFDLVIKRKPDLADAFMNRSTALLRVGETSKSVLDAKKAVTLAATNAYAYQRLGAALRRNGQFNEAREALELSFRYSKDMKNDSVAMAHFNLGAVYQELNEKRGSEHLNAAIRMQPKLARVLFHQGTYDGALGLPDDGIQVLTRKPTRRNTGSTTSVTKLKRSKPAPAVNPAPAQTTSTGRKIELSTFDLKDCVLLSSKMIEISPEKPEAYYTLALGQFSLGEYAKAAENFQKFADKTKSGQTYQRALLLAFLALELAGKQDDAKKCLVSANTASGGTLLEVRYFLNQSSEADLISSKRSLLDQTRAHCYLGLRAKSQSKPQDHLTWVLKNGELSSDEIVLAAAETKKKLN